MIPKSLCIVSSLLLGLIPVWPSAPAEADFEWIFDGQSLTGWQGDIDKYEIEAGAIRCRAGKGGTLYTLEQYSDFIVKLEFQLPPGGNNGLAIRYPGHGDPAYTGMCELQVLDNMDAKYTDLDVRQYHGSAYGMVAAKRGFLKPIGEWNAQTVTVVSSTLKVELNGELILECDLDEVREFLADKKHPGKSLKTGYFGFAGHKDPVAFRNIRIKRL